MSKTFYLFIYFIFRNNNESGVNKPRFINSSGAKTKDTPLTNNANTNNKQQQYNTNNAYSINTNNKEQHYNTNNAYSSNTNNTASSSSNKPNFVNTKGKVNNNTPFNPDAKVEKQEDKRSFINTKGKVNNNTPFNPDAKVQEDLKDAKKFTGSFQKTNNMNAEVKAPKKTYLEGSSEVKYKEEDFNIEKRVFQSNKNETNFVDIKNNQDVN